MITDRIIHDILDVDLVIADLSFLNPNVFWELGIRHSALRPVIHIAERATKIPFDNFGHRAIFFDLREWGSIIEARKNLLLAARAVAAKSFQVSNPLTQARASFNMRQSSDPVEKMVVNVMERLAAIERNVSHLSAEANLRTFESHAMLAESLDRAGLFGSTHSKRLISGLLDPGPDRHTFADELEKKANERLRAALTESSPQGNTSQRGSISSTQDPKNRGE